MKKTLAMLLALAMSLSLVACGSKTEPAPAPENPSTPEVEAPAAASTLAVCLASEPDTIDPALNSAVDGATMVSHLFSGLAKWAQDADGNLVIAADAAE